MFQTTNQYSFGCVLLIYLFIHFFIIHLFFNLHMCVYLCLEDMYVSVYLILYMYFKKCIRSCKCIYCIYTYRYIEFRICKVWCEWIYMCICNIYIYTHLPPGGATRKIGSGFFLKNVFSPKKKCLDWMPRLKPRSLPSRGSIPVYLKIGFSSFC
jgi:glycosyltransferase involved in cell wall biosynthesis